MQLQCVSQNFWQTVSEVRLKFPEYTTNLPISLRSCQSNHELQKVVNFMLNFVGKLWSSIWWVGNITTNVFKQSEKIPQPSNAYFKFLIDVATMYKEISRQFPWMMGTSLAMNLLTSQQSWREIHNFASKFMIWLTTMQIAKFVANFRNFTRTSKTICQKLIQIS